jgi:hypothetical protein
MHRMIKFISPLCVCYSLAGSKGFSCITCLFPSDKSIWHFTKMDKQKRELTTEDESEGKELKVIKMESNSN